MLLFIYQLLDISNLMNWIEVLNSAYTFAILVAIAVLLLLLVAKKDKKMNKRA